MNINLGILISNTVSESEISFDDVIFSTEDEMVEAVISSSNDMNPTKLMQS